GGRVVFNVLRTRVGRAVVDHDHSVRPTRLGGQGIESQADGVGGVVEGNDDADRVILHGEGLQWMPPPWRRPRTAAALRAGERRVRASTHNTRNSPER